MEREVLMGLRRGGGRTCTKELPAGSDTTMVKGNTEPIAMRVSSVMTPAT